MNFRIGLSISGKTAAAILMGNVLSPRWGVPEYCHFDGVKPSVWNVDFFPLTCVLNSFP